MKNKKTVFFSILIFAVCVFYLIPIINFLFCKIFQQEVELKILFFFVDNNITNLPNRFTIVCLLFPVFLSVSIIELLILFLRKSTLGVFRFGLIVVSLLFVGYLIIKTFLTAFQAALSGTDSFINKSFQVVGIEFPMNLVIIVLIIFVIFIYSNKATKKIKEYIN